MPRYLLSDPARADLATILRTSRSLHGEQARVRYRALLTAAMRRVAGDPDGHATVDRGALSPGLRSYHLRHSRHDGREGPVANPVHILFYRAAAPGFIEIVRVLHDRMDPDRLVVAKGSG